MGSREAGSGVNACGLVAAATAAADTALTGKLPDTKLQAQGEVVGRNVHARAQVKSMRRETLYP